jgi:energy-coupling factor transporter ATP-binding protein EcfA2
MPHLLDIQGLKTHFKTDDGWLHAVDGVDIAIDAGQTVCVVGESGCGKSVTAKTVMKLIDMPPGKIVAGRVLWQGRDLVPLPPTRCEDPRQGDRDDLPGADDEPEPGLHRSASRSPRACGCTKAWARRGDGPRGRDAAAGQHPDARAARQATTRTSSPAACASA